MRKLLALLLILFIAPRLWRIQAADPPRAVPGNPPRLIETLYRARLVDASLEGTADWKIVNPQDAPAVLPVQPLGIAVRRSVWQQGGPAILGNLQGALGLLVEQAGESHLELDWSARSSPVTGGLRFSLEVPACAIGFLELELPADRAVSVSRENFHLAGPLPAKTANHQLWRIGFSGRTPVNFLIRRVSGAGIPAALVLARVKSQQTLTPGELDADYEFELEVVHGGVSKLVCDCDPGLRPYQVTIRNLEDWSLKAGKTPGSPGQLHIRLREPFVGGPLLIRCLASITPNAAWSSPGIRLVDAVTRDEKLILDVDPEIQLEDLQPGSFRLVDAAKGQSLTLTAGIEAGPNLTRPRAKLAMSGPEYDVRQLTWWELTPDQQRLTTRLACTVKRGRLFRLPLQLPPGWEVEHVDIPADRQGHWTVVPDKAKPLLLIDLQRSLDPATLASLTVRLRRDPPGAGTLPFPEVLPLGARQREGALGISLSSAFQASVSAVAAPISSGPEPDKRAPWVGQPLDYHFPFQGRPVEGALTLRSRASQVRATCGQDVAVASGRALVVTRLELAPEVGAPQHVDLFISGADIGAWDWRTLRGGNGVERMERREAVHFAEPLKLLAARNALQAAALASLPRPRGSWWRLQLARPLTEPLILEARLELTGRESVAALAVQVALLGSRQALDVVTLAPAAAHLAEGPLQRRVWELPLVCVLGGERVEGTVTLHLTGADPVQIETHGLREVANTRPASKRQPATPWRTYRYSQPPATLTLRSDVSTVDRSRAAVVDAAHLTSYLEPNGRLVHHYRFRIRDWRQQTLTIQLPATVQLLAARGDGGWVTRLPGPRLDGAMVEYDLPLPGRGGVHHYELLYTTSASHFTLWRRLTAPVPNLPVEPLVLERTWLLPPGVTPLREDGLRQGPGAKPRPWLPAALADLAESADWQAQQEQAVTEAILAVRKEHGAGEAWSLGQLLERVALRHLKDRAILIVDTEALAELGVSPSSSVPAEAWEAKGEPPWSPRLFPLPVPWESVGLTYQPCRPAPLLTSRTQQLLWEGNAALIEPAVAEAARYGQDRSGRFRRLTEWLEQGSVDSPDLPDELASGIHESWTEWQPLPGSTHPGSLLVIRPGAVPLIGVVLGLMLALASVRLGPQPGRRRFRLFLIWLAVGGLGLLWLPAPLRPLAWGPALVGIAVGLIWCLRLALGLRRASAAATAASLTLLLLAIPDGASAQVVAPPAVIAQLKAARPTGGRLLSADYRGKVDGNQAVFEARYRLHSFDTAPVSVTVPLGGVQLLDAWLDDEVTQPVRVETGYSVRLPSAGPHELLLRFSVLLPMAGEERDLRLSIPELPQSRLTLEVPQPASYLHVVDARGGQKQTSDAAMARLEADLGAMASVRVRWRQEEAQAPSKPRAVSIREAYYWELKPSSARLLAVLQYQVSKGWLSRAVIELPRELEVVSVETGPSPGVQSAPRLKDWTLRPGDGQRRLEIEFASPVTASVQITLELTPRQSLGRVANLPFPTPLDGQLSRGFLGYRLENLAPAGPEKALAITGMAKEEQESSFNDWFAIPWGVARQEKLPPPSLSFWRMKGGGLQLTLQPSSALPACSQEIVWRVDPQQATLQANLTLAAPQSPLSLVQWEVPAGLMIADLDGPHLAHWTRSGNRIQAWLDKPVTETSMQLSGWLPRPPKAPPRFDIPLLRVLDTAAPKTSLRIVAAQGAAMSPSKLSNLTARTDQDVPGKEWNFTTSQASYGGSFTLNPGTPHAFFHLLTFAEVRDRQLVFASTIVCRVQRGELRRLTVSVRHGEGGDWKLDAPGAIKVEERKLPGGARAWLIDLPPGVATSYQLKLNGRLPLEAVNETRMPDVRIEPGEDGPPAQERWLGVAGPDLETQGASGLEVVADLTTALGFWPREVDRLRRAGGTAWQVRADDWRLRLTPRGPAIGSPVQLFLAEYEAAASDRQRWLHRATYRLAHEGGADLVLSLREGARILGVSVNGTPAPPLLQPGGNRLWLPLPGGPGQQTVEVLWTYAAGSETIDQPILEPPLLEGMIPKAVVWKIQVPPGYQVRSDPSQAGSAACLDLSRAQAMLQFMTWISDQPAADATRAAAFATADASFERHLRFAEYRLNLDNAGSDMGGRALLTWLAGLRQQRSDLESQPAVRSLLEANKERPAREDAVTVRLGLAAFEEGRPAYWYGGSATGVPPLRLVSEETGRLRQTATLSVLLVGLLFASWVLATIFGAVAWPEQLALLGLLGVLIFGGGLGLVFLILPAIWLLVRLTHLLLHVWSWLPRRHAETPAPAGSQAS